MLIRNYFHTQTADDGSQRYLASLLKEAVEYDDDALTETHHFYELRNGNTVTTVAYLTKNEFNHIEPADGAEIYAVSLHEILLQALLLLQYTPNEIDAGKVARLTAMLTLINSAR